MKRFSEILIFICCFLLSSQLTGKDSCSECGDIVFIENKSQWEQEVLFKAQISGGSLFVENRGFTYSFYDTEQYEDLLQKHHQHHPGFQHQNKKIACHAVKMSLESANQSPYITGTGKTTDYYNYFIGKDRSKWASRVHAFKQVGYSEIYDGIDLKIYSQESFLKYDYDVKKGADPSAIAMRYSGMKNMELKEGKLIILTSVNRIEEQEPYAYQVIRGKRRSVACEFILDGDLVSFSFPDGYDEEFNLVIDPVVIFSTYSGSQANNFGYTATFDSDGNLYAGGSAFGVPGFDYPTTTGAYQVLYGGGIVDIGITKYAEDGSVRLYSTYLGGNSTELPHSFIVNSNDELFVFGTTSSNNFPTTTGAFDSTFNGGQFLDLSNGLGVTYTGGSDIVVARFSADGATLLASTYVGGSGNDGLNTSASLKYNYADEVRGEIFVDDDNNCYVATCTNSGDFPTTTDAFMENSANGLDACVFKLDNNLTTMVWGTFLAGFDDDAAYSIVLDKQGDIYVAGGTRSVDFPVTSGVVQPFQSGGLSDAFVSHLSANGQNLLQSTLWGAPGYDQAYFVELDRDDYPHLLGQTDAPDSTYIFNALYSVPNSGQFITKLSPELDTLIWSTCFGTGDGGPDISPTAFLVDVCNKAYVSGWGGNLNNQLGLGSNSTTTGMDILPGAFQSNTDGNDFYIMVLEDDASQIVYSSFFGGINAAGTPVSQDHVDGGTSRFDKNGIMYQSVCAGCGGLSDFPIEPDPDSVVSAVNGSLLGSLCNNAVFKFDLELPLALALFDVPPIGCAPFTVQFMNYSNLVSAGTYLWKFGDGDTSTLLNPTHTYDSAGFYSVTLIVSDPFSCNLTDSIVKDIIILSNRSDTIDPAALCGSGSVQIGLPPNSDPSVTYIWSPSTGLNQTDIPNPIATISTDQVYTLMISNGICTDTLVQEVFVLADTLSLVPDNFIICPGDSVQLVVNNSNVNNNLSYSWSPSDVIVSGDTTATPTAQLATTTTMSVTATNTLGCTYQESVIIAVYPPSALIDPDPSNLCVGDTLQLGVDTFTFGDVLTFQWTPANMIIQGASTPNPLISPDQNTTFYLATQSSFGCTFIDSILISVLANGRSALPDENICDSEGALIGPLNIDTNLSYLWTPAAGLNQPDIPNPTAAPVVNTDYVLLVTNGNCTDTIDQRVNVFFNGVYIAGQPDICLGNTIDLTATADNPSEIVSYIWTPSPVIILGNNTASVTALPSDTTDIIVTAANFLGCQFRDTITVFVSDNFPSVVASANPDTIELGESTMLQASANQTVSWNWIPFSSLSANNISNPIATPEETTTYIVTGVNAQGCAALDTVTVYLKTDICGDPYIYVPNAFTPNNDGKNDVLFVRGQNITELDFTIYDRWGEKLFTSTNISNGWNGSFNGKQLDPGVFAYYLEAVCENGEVYSLKGNVTIIR